uniref:Activator of basal transcription 1 n=1 Tax=Lygus hesperus TaxID=30085 RepID=A0A146L642_LYGHE
MGGKKKDRFHDHLWNLKYLSRFKWIHLVERLSFEKAVMRQKMQNEISQAKRVANFFKETVEREERQRKRLKKGNSGASENTSSAGGPSPYVFAQRETVEEKKAKKPQVNQDRENFLKSLFS